MTHSAFMKYYPRIRHDVPTVPIVLIGTKLELRKAAGPQQGGGNMSQADNGFTYEEGVAMAKLIGAAAYIECSEHDPGSMERVSALLAWVGIIHKTCKDTFLLSKGLEEAPPKASNFSLLKSRCIIS